MKAPERLTRTVVARDATVTTSEVRNTMNTGSRSLTLPVELDLTITSTPEMIVARMPQPIPPSRLLCMCQLSGRLGSETIEL